MCHILSLALKFWQCFCCVLSLIVLLKNIPIYRWSYLDSPAAAGTFNANLIFLALLFEHQIEFHFNILFFFVKSVLDHAMGC